MGIRLASKTAVALLLLAASACTVHNGDEGPAPFGPSDFALSIGLTITPDSITQDGASQASVVVTAHDENGRPKPGVVVRLDIEVDGEVQDFGRLSARTVVTGTDGRATAVYTAPPLDPFAGGFGRFITIIATPSGNNTQALNFRTAEIRLVPPGVILPPPSAPRPAFTFTPTPVVAGIGVNFDASASDPGAGAAQIVTYNWNFGDGDTGTGIAPRHSFDVAGTYLVTLTVINDRGLAASVTNPVSVSAAAAPAGDWVFSPANPAVGETIFFNADTIVPPAGRTFTSYNWNFGDGTAGTGRQPTHSYSTAANYVVVLTLTDDVGQTTVRQRTISIGTGNPNAAFTSTVTNATTHTMLFDASGSTASGGATITSYAWNFGDGSTGTGQSASRTYGAAGSYPVRLTVTDSLGRTGTILVTVTVP